MAIQLPSQQEEQQVKEFLKRAEIRTMRKDLSMLREKDALRERDKIVNIKTVEEQQAVLKQQQAAAKAETDKARRETILAQQSKREYAAETDLKQYATEQERQQIFLMESQRLSLQKQIETIESQQEPPMALQKNAILLDSKRFEEALTTMIASEKKIEDEQTLIAQQANKTTIPAEHQALEARRFDLDKSLQEIEKRRWAIEKQIEADQNQVKAIDGSLAQLVIQKNQTKQNMTAIDAALRNLYTSIMQREQNRKANTLQEQQQKQAELAKIHADQNEQVRNQQWATHQQPGQNVLGKSPESLREKLEREAASEEDRRQKFLRDVEQASAKGGSQQLGKSTTN